MPRRDRPWIAGWRVGKRAEPVVGAGQQLLQPAPAPGVGAAGREEGSADVGELAVRERRPGVAEEAAAARRRRSSARAAPRPDSAPRPRVSPRDSASRKSSNGVRGDTSVAWYAASALATSTSSGSSSHRRAEHAPVAPRRGHGRVRAAPPGAAASPRSRRRPVSGTSDAAHSESAAPSQRNQRCCPASSRLVVLRPWREKRRPSWKPRFGSWQLAQASWPLADSRLSKNSRRPSSIASGRPSTRLPASALRGGGHGPCDSMRARSSAVKSTLPASTGRRSQRSRRAPASPALHGSMIVSSSRSLRAVRLHVQPQLPAARHVEHQPFDAPAAVAERLHAGAVVHAVAVLGHRGVDARRAPRRRGTAAPRWRSDGRRAIGAPSTCHAACTRAACIDGAGSGQAARRQRRTEQQRRRLLMAASASRRTARRHSCRRCARRRRRAGRPATGATSSRVRR